MLISIETHIICDFPGGRRGDILSIPPLNPHMIGLEYQFLRVAISSGFTILKSHLLQILA